MPHSDKDIENAETLVSLRCEEAIERFLAFCERNEGKWVIWESIEDPWSFRVIYTGESWTLEDIDFEIDGMDDFFEGVDLSSREGMEAVLCSVLIPLAMEAALGEIPGRSANEFLDEMDAMRPLIDLK